MRRWFCILLMTAAAYTANDPGPDQVPEWAQQGKFRFARLDGGPIEIMKTARSAWGMHFTDPLYLNWFYPAFMLVVGTHYMPFIFLYGMWEFAILSAVLVGGGAAIGMLAPDVFAAGGWYTAIALLLFALLVQIRPSIRKINPTT